MSDVDLDWTEAGPRSRRFGDVYFSAEDGLAESRAVFLAGCGLPEGWAGRRRFTVAELGFGTGLNVLALLELWSRRRPPGGTLHVFSVEADPLARTDAARALAAWPELAPVAMPLLDRWPARAPGFHRLDFPELGVTVDVAHAEAAEALAAWSGAADAWFLDGFAPARNPEMWRDEVLDLVAARSRPGARLATYTVAGAVRRGLQARGFELARRPGHGRKRERLEARLRGEPAAEPAVPTIAVVGAGIAGASLARAFTALGARPMLLAAEGEPAASANPAALVTPRLDAGGGAAARLWLQGWRRAAALYDEVPGAVLSRGVLQLEAAERDVRRFDALAASGLFARGEVERLDAAAASEASGEPLSTGGLSLPQALVVDPAVVGQAWTGAADRRTFHVAGIKRLGQGWLLTATDGPTATADLVCLAAGWGAAALLAPFGVPLEPVRGQVTFASAPPPPPRMAAAWGAYVAPAPGGMLFGSTHDRGDGGAEPRQADDARNLSALAARLPRLAETLAAAPLTGRASVRATTRDRAPIAGELAPGLYVLGGLGSRGFATAPLLAEHLAALALGAPSPLPGDLAPLVSPSRASLRSAGG